MKAKVQGLLVAAAILVAPPAFADDCIVQDAAQAALDRQMAIIKGSAVDVEGIFSGPNSCINADILKSFDLSNLIIDPMSWVTGSITDAINKAINDAKMKVCEAIQDKIDGTVGSVKTAITGSEAGLSGELKGILQNGWDGIKL